MPSGWGDALIAVGVGLVLLGLVVRGGLLGWFGHLPGDLRYESGGTFVFVPFTSMLVVSGALSAARWLLGR